MTILNREAELSERVSNLAGNYELLQEKFAELSLALDDKGWMRLNDLSGDEFNRDDLAKITHLARLMVVKNPIVQRGVRVKQFYVWAQGMTTRAKDDDLNAVLQEFIDDPKNRAELTGHQALMLKEVDLEVEGNIFFVFFTTPNTGRVHVRSIPFDEIQDVVCNPEDSKEPRYYKRVWTEKTSNPETGLPETKDRTDYYPDWGYNPAAKPTTVYGQPCHWDAPVYHIKVGGFTNWKFGLCEFYAAIDWATAYKKFLENWATITQALTRFAWNLTTPGGKAGIATAKTKIGTGLPESAGNPPPVTGATFIASDSGAKLDPVRTAGATTSADDSRRIGLMAMMPFGLPETFYADAQSGSLATAKSLDRPTELMMIDRQAFWRDVFLNIYRFVLIQAVAADKGKLRGKGTVELIDDGADRTQILTWNKGVGGSIDVSFPPIVSDDMAAQMNALVSLATLNGMAKAGTIDDRTLTAMGFRIIGVKEADEVMKLMFDDDGNLLKPPASAAPTPSETDPNAAAAQEAFVGALREVRAVMAKQLREAV